MKAGLFRKIAVIFFLVFSIMPQISAGDMTVSASGGVFFPHLMAKVHDGASGGGVELVHYYNEMLDKIGWEADVRFEDGFIGGTIGVKFYSSDYTEKRYMQFPILADFCLTPSIDRFVIPIRMSAGIFLDFLGDRCSLGLMAAISLGFGYDIMEHFRILLDYQPQLLYGISFGSDSSLRLDHSVKLCVSYIL